MSYRPVDPDLVPRLIRENYAADYEYLSQNDPNYPTPEEMMGLFKVGNIAFEGDVRYDTEGSDWIKQCILDDDPARCSSPTGAASTPPCAPCSLLPKSIRTRQNGKACAKRSSTRSTSWAWAKITAGKTRTWTGSTPACTPMVPVRWWLRQLLCRTFGIQRPAEHR